MTEQQGQSKKRSPRKLRKGKKEFFSPGDSLRIIREARGITIHAAAKDLHCSHKVITGIEQGYIRDASMKKFIDYCDYIGAMVIIAPYTPPAGADMRSQNVTLSVTGKNQTLANFIRPRDNEVTKQWYE